MRRAEAKADRARLCHRAQNTLPDRSSPGCLAPAPHSRRSSSAAGGLVEGGLHKRRGNTGGVAIQGLSVLSMDLSLCSYHPTGLPALFPVSAVRSFPVETLRVWLLWTSHAEGVAWVEDRDVNRSDMGLRGFSHEETDMRRSMRQLLPGPSPAAEGRDCGGFLLQITCNKGGGLLSIRLSRETPEFCSGERPRFARGTPGRTPERKKPPAGVSDLPGANSAAGLRPTR